MNKIVNFIDLFEEIPNKLKICIVLRILLSFFTKLELSSVEKKRMENFHFHCKNCVELIPGRNLIQNCKNSLNCLCNYTMLQIILKIFHLFSLLTKALVREINSIKF